LKIKYTKFTFHEPPFPSKGEYEEMKNFLESNPNLKLIPPNDFPQKFTLDLILIAVLLILVLVAFLTPNENVQMVIGIIASFLFISIVIGAMVDTLRSFLVFSLSRKLYYSRLQRSIIKAEDYEDFIKKMKKRGFFGDFISIWQ
jgi:hypothetical protein